MLGNDLAIRRTAEWRRPERRGRFEDDLHRVTVELVHPHDVPVRSDGDGGGARVHHVFPVEHHVVGGEGLAVVPDDVLLELPGDGHSVLRGTAVLETWCRGSQNRNDVAMGSGGGEG